MCSFGECSRVPSPVGVSTKPGREHKRWRGGQGPLHAGLCSRKRGELNSQEGHRLLFCKVTAPVLFACAQGNGPLSRRLFCGTATGSSSKKSALGLNWSEKKKKKKRANPGRCYLWRMEEEECLSWGGGGGGEMGVECDFFSTTYCLSLSLPTG